MTFLGIMSLLLAFVIGIGIMMTVAQLWITTLFNGLLARTWVSRNLFFGKDLSPGYHQVLYSNLKFYRALPPSSQKLFRRRVRFFIKGRQFHGRHGLEVTEEMKVLLSASAIKLTFGLDHFVFDSFKNIFVYPEPYYSTTTGNMHKGETHPVGAVVFSWKDFLHGIEDEEDNLNLGLHEFSHAFILELKKGNIPDELLMEHFLELKKVIFNPRVRQAVLNHGYLREYGQENFMEFVAVCVESYFETPDQFRAQIPALYAHLCKMLNQDTHHLYSRFPNSV